MPRAKQPYRSIKAEDYIRDGLYLEAAHYLRSHGFSVPTSIDTIIRGWERKARLMKSLKQEWTEDIRNSYHNDMQKVKTELTKIMNDAA